jgi:hypothetical protein
MSLEEETHTDALRRTKLDLRGIVWFLSIAYGIAWLLAVPVWLGGQGPD